MKHVNPLITSGTGLFKAVCHKCHYVGFEPNTTTCMSCGFPLLLEPCESAHMTLREILDRSTLELKGTGRLQPLPGVNRTAKQRQRMLADAQRRLSSASAEPPRVADRTPVPRSSGRLETLEESAPRASTSEGDRAPVQSHAVKQAAFSGLSSAPGRRSTATRYATSAGSAPAHQARLRMGMVLAFASALVATLAMAAATAGSF